MPAVQLALVGTCDASGTTPSPVAKKDDSELSAEASRPGSLLARLLLRPGRKPATDWATWNRVEKFARSRLQRRSAAWPRLGGGPAGSSQTSASTLAERRGRERQSPRVVVCAGAADGQAEAGERIAGSGGQSIGKQAAQPGKNLRQKGASRPPRRRSRCWRASCAER